MRVVVFGPEPLARWRTTRTLRAARRAGVEPLDFVGRSRDLLAAFVRENPGPLWLLRAGTWPTYPRPFVAPPPSATGRPLVALGNAAPSGEIPSAYLDATAAAMLAERLSDHLTIADAIRATANRADVRAVPVPALDVRDDSEPRVLQLVTSLQRGGAERVALDLARHQERAERFHSIATIGRPRRGTYPPPADWLDLAPIPKRAERFDAITRFIAAEGVDLIHAHLLDRDDLARFAPVDVPVVVTIHNTRPGWPVGLERIEPGDAALLVSCSLAAEADLTAAELPVPTRTVWNGIDPSPFASTPDRIAKAATLRNQLGLRPEEFVVVALANPRPQKRLHLLPAVLSELRTRLAPRPVRLLLAGEASSADPLAHECVHQIHAELVRHGVTDRTLWLGPVADVATLLLAADALVSVSAYEGLSLAHLEALAAGRPVVASDAGGTAELARSSPGVTVLPLDAPPEAFAEALARAERPAATRPFTLEQMAERYRLLYDRLFAAPAVGTGLWLVTNNFSTGGAQSSAKRLLLGLAADGVRARAAVLEEQPDYPTPGRSELVATGVPVVVASTAEAVLRAIEADPPRAVLFWNALAEVKVRLADALLGVRVFDVSPGEMYFRSLDRFFANPPHGLPYLAPSDYGRRLAGVVVKYAAERDRAEALGAPVAVIPNGVPLPTVRERSNDRLIIGTLARISPQKKLEELVSAVRLAHDRLPPYELRIAGSVERDSGDYSASLRRSADGLNVVWVGEQESYGFLAELDLFAAVSEPAGCPNATLEAMAAGLPIVATEWGGASEQVAEGLTGRLVPRGDSSRFADALVELAADPTTRRRMGVAGRQRVEERFTIARMVAGYRRVCLGV